VSLINQMLRDLDARESQRPQLSAVDSPAPVVARETIKPKSKRGLVLLIIIAFALVGWFGFPQTHAWIDKVVNVGTGIIQAIMAKVPAVAEQKTVENPPVEIPVKQQELTVTVDTSETRTSKSTEPVVETSSTTTPIAEKISSRAPVITAPVETAKKPVKTVLPKLEAPAVETVVALNDSQGAGAALVVTPETLAKSNSQLPEAVKASPVRPANVPVKKQVVEAGKPAAIAGLKEPKQTVQAPVLAKVKANSKRSDKTSVVSKQKVPNRPVKPTIKVKEPVKLTPSELADKYYRRANAARTAGRYEQSERHLVSALEIDSGHGSARKLLAKLLMNNGSLDEARNVISQGLQLAPADPGLIALEARIVMHQGGLEQAQELLENGLIRQGDNLELLALLGVLYQQDNDFQGALKVYQKLVSLQSGEGRNWAGLAISYDAINSGQKALQAYRQAVSLGGLPSEILSYTQTRITALERTK